MLYTPFVWSEEAGLKGINVFFVLKNFAKLVDRKNYSQNRSIPPGIFIS